MKKQKLKTKTSSRFFEGLNRLLFFVFILLLPTQLGKHFFFPFSYLSGIRVDYLSPTLYLIDLVVLALFAFNFKTVLSFFKKKAFFIFFLGLLLNIALAKSQPLALYGSLRIIELMVVVALGSKALKSLGPLYFLFALGLTGLAELGLSIAQIVGGQSLQGPFYYLGERLMSLGTPGIAKIAVKGAEFLRPYGTFSHPNSMGGFYLLLYFFVLVAKDFQKHLLLKYSLLFVFSCLVFLSFSKTAISTFLIFNAIFYIVNRKGLCKICVISRLLILGVISLIFLMPTGDPVTLEKRVELLGNSVQIIKNNLLTGVGLNNYLLAQSSFSSKFPMFVNQPVHNIFSLFVSETGLLGLIAIYFLFRFLKDRLSKNQWILVGVVLLTGMVDHYWLTLVQNLLLVGVVFSFTDFRDPSSPGDLKPRSDEVARQIL